MIKYRKLIIDGVDSSIYEYDTNTNMERQIYNITESSRTNHGWDVYYDINNDTDLLITNYVEIELTEAEAFLIML